MYRIIKVCERRTNMFDTLKELYASEIYRSVGLCAITTCPNCNSKVVRQILPQTKKFLCTRCKGEIEVAQCAVKIYLPSVDGDFCCQACFHSFSPKVPVGTLLANCPSCGNICDRFVSGDETLIAEKAKKLKKKYGHLLRNGPKE